MLSRRNIRIKVMHLLYAKRLDPVLEYKDLKKRFDKTIEQSFDLYMFNIWQLVKITEFAQKDAAKRSAKHLPTEADKAFTPKLYNNTLLKSISNNEGFNKVLKKKLIPAKIDADMSRLFYTEFAKTEEYKNYLNNPSAKEDHLNILLALYKFCCGNETFNDYMEDNFDNWIHDKSLIVGSVKKTFKALPVSDSFYEDYYPSDETTREFGEDLLYKATFFNNDLLEIIKPALKNWDAGRVAIIDMELIKLALAEMIYFPTIPVKVSINEFVDISKLYSTPKSKDFINGILDRLMKKLLKDGVIKKEGRGLLD